MGFTFEDFTAAMIGFAFLGFMITFMCPWGRPMTWTDWALISFIGLPLGLVAVAVLIAFPGLLVGLVFLAGILATQR